MSAPNHMLRILSVPENGRVYSKSPASGVLWVATQEANCFLVWRGFASRENPWGEADWTWEILEAHTDRDNAVESCVLKARKEWNEAIATPVQEEGA